MLVTQPPTPSLSLYLLLPLYLTFSFFHPLTVPLSLSFSSISLSLSITHSLTPHWQIWILFQEDSSVQLRRALWQISVSLSLYIYIYIYRYKSVSLSIYLSFFLSLSLTYSLSQHQKDLILFTEGSLAASAAETTWQISIYLSIDLNLQENWLVQLRRPGRSIYLSIYFFLFP